MCSVAELTACRQTPSLFAEWHVASDTEYSKAVQLNKLATSSNSRGYKSTITLHRVMHTLSKTLAPVYCVYIDMDNYSYTYVFSLSLPPHLSFLHASFVTQLPSTGS